MSTHEKRRESSFPGREIRWVLVPLIYVWQDRGRRSRGAAGIAEGPCPPRSCLVAAATVVPFEHDKIGPVVGAHQVSALSAQVVLTELEY